MSATDASPSTPDAGSAEPGALPPATVRVERGNPTPEELAAVVTVLAATGDGDPAPGAPRSPWGGARRAARPVLSPGPDSWRMSAYPR